MSTQVHVCYALYDKKGTFSKYIGTSMTSLFENTKADVTVHLLHDSTLTDENRRLFAQTAKTYGQSICFYDMESAAGEVLQGVLKILPAAVVTRFSQAALYRLLVGIVLPVSSSMSWRIRICISFSPLLRRRKRKRRYAMITCQNGVPF